MGPLRQELMAPVRRQQTGLAMDIPMWLPLRRSRTGPAMRKLVQAADTEAHAADVVRVWGPAFMRARAPCGCAMRVRVRECVRKHVPHADSRAQACACACRACRAYMRACRVCGCPPPPPRARAVHVPACGVRECACAWTGGSCMLMRCTHMYGVCTCACAHVRMLRVCVRACVCAFARACRA